MKHQVVRVLVYESDDAEELQRQLGASMNDGTRVGRGSVSITALTIPPTVLRALKFFTAGIPERIEQLQQLREPAKFEAAVDYQHADPGV